MVRQAEEETPASWEREVHVVLTGETWGRGDLRQGFESRDGVGDMGRSQTVPRKSRATPQALPAHMYFKPLGRQHQHSG